MREFKKVLLLNLSVEHPDKSWIHRPFPKRKYVQQYFSIPEVISFIGFLGNAILIWLLAKNAILFPWVMWICTLFQAFLLYFSSFNEYDPPAWLHFFHPVYGVIIFSPIIQSGVYFLTYMVRFFSYEAITVAQQTVIIQGYISLWAIAASISLIGLYFAYQIVPSWFLFLDRNSFEIDVPFPLYLGIIFYILLAAGAWLTTINNIIYNLLKREYYGKNTKFYRKYAPFVILTVTCISLVLFIFESKFYAICISDFL